MSEGLRVHAKLAIRTLLCVALLGTGTASVAQTTLLRFERLIDGTGEILQGREIVVENGTIAAIGDDLGARYPSAKRIDLDDLVAVPGLIDAHVHMTYALSAPSQGDAWRQLFATPAADRLVGATHNAVKTLQTGVTSARDLFAFDSVDFHLKALIDSGVIPGPRLFISGEGIHPMTLTPLPAGEQRDVVAEFSKKAEQRVAAGADWVKIFATTGSADDLSGKQHFFYPEIKAATDIAHAAGLRVAIHSYGPSAVGDALIAGVDSIDHPVGLDGDLLELWSQTDTMYVPTIDHNRYYADHRNEYGYDDEIERNLRDFVKRNVESLRRAHEAGIRIAMGSDAVMTMFGQNTRELEWFVDAGMTPGEALQAATVNGAALLGRAQSLGRLRQGFAADIVGVRGDPVSDIRAVTRNVVWVMKAGRVVVDRGSNEVSGDPDRLY
jgi:imidazolonepropionase-like amidohydrolase